MQFRLEVESRGAEGFLVIRPDSGDPTENVLKVLKVLAEKFGAEKNKKGFKVLPPYIRILQGK